MEQVDVAQAAKAGESPYDNIDVKALADDAVSSIFGSEEELSLKQIEPISRRKIEDAWSSWRLWATRGVMFPENAEFFNTLHTQVLEEGRYLEEDDGITTMRITSIGFNGKTYLLPLYSPTDNRVLDTNDPEDVEQLKILASELEAAGIITPYNSVEQAEEDKDKFYDSIIQRTHTPDTSEKVYKFNEGGKVPDTKKPLGYTIANMLGIKDEDLRWAEKLGKSYGEDEKLDGRGDAARHLALGWLASRSEHPDLAKKAIDAREYLQFDANKSMDIDNNAKGAAIKAEDREEAESIIKQMIEDESAVFMSLEESRRIRGYEEGGEVQAAPNKLEPGIYQDDVGNLFKVTTEGDVQYVSIKQLRQGQ